MGVRREWPERLYVGNEVRRGVLTVHRSEFPLQGLDKLDGARVRYDQFGSLKSFVFQVATRRARGFALAGINMEIIAWDFWGATQVTS